MLFKQSFRSMVIKILGYKWYYYLINLRSETRIIIDIFNESYQIRFYNFNSFNNNEEY